MTPASPAPPDVRPAAPAADPAAGPAQARPTAARAQLALPADPRAVPEARHALASSLRGAGVDEALAADACLVLTELVANAVQHGTARADGTYGVRWSVAPGLLELEVRDGGPAPRGAGADRDPGEPGGRGLVLVRALAATYERSRDADGTLARATLTRPPHP